MKTILALCCFCCFALVQKITAQTVATDTASAAKPAKPDPRAGHLRAMRYRNRVLGPMSAPFPGQPASRARNDTRSFKLPKNLVGKAKDGEIAATSDYFKPTAASTPDPQLLADSAYVKDYRFYAYNMGIRQSKDPLATGFIIGGSILVVLTGIVALFVALGNIHIQPHMY